MYIMIVKSNTSMANKQVLMYMKFEADKLITILIKTCIQIRLHKAVTLIY